MPFRKVTVGRLSHSHRRCRPNVSRLCMIFEWVCTTRFYFFYIYIFFLYIFFHPYRRNNVRFFMPFKLLQSLKSINKINDRPPLCSCCSIVRLQQPYKENGQYSVKASCASGHCLLYSVLTCWYKFQGFNPGCGSSVVAGEAQRGFQIRVRVKYNVRSFCCYSNTMALLLTYTHTHPPFYIYI